ncbi:hypothetical protein BG844_28390 [Couchioplanes caeruleus subsp. caeruleus]|uniref:Uncharacterized protein n=1 Tax=Couchioplanes caeruleus subsp. caeruleus TaxID=56427 RepID=A0A1K0FDZ9_9ACTN|nr:hypothetical protein BG844_28390 [Couchioplanes caeruleus subsp. caeruleus]
MPWDCPDCSALGGDRAGQVLLGQAEVVQQGLLEDRRAVLGNRADAEFRPAGGADLARDDHV